MILGMKENDLRIRLALAEGFIILLLIAITILAFYVHSLSSHLDEVEMKVEELEQTVEENSSQISDLETSVEENESQINEIKDELNL
ncbi:MAG: hypothetical protein MSG77_01035 [Prevotella sp.]|nr:hypothetical protein [Prevotella sp.]